MSRNGLLIPLSLALATLLVLTAVATPERPIVVHRVISDSTVAEIISDGERVVLVRRGRSSLLGASPFNMPPKYVLKTTRAPVEKAFENAMSSLKCGDRWRRRLLTSEESAGELGEWRVFYNDRCSRSEIMSRGSVVFDSVALRRYPLTLVTVIDASKPR